MGGKLGKRNGSMMTSNGIIGDDPRRGMNDRQKRREAKKFIAKQLAKHPCGDCRACCYVKQVEAIGKPEFTMCNHAEEGKRGCSIYAKRPQSCKDYFCGYRYGLIGDGELLRPDKSGLLFDVAEHPPPGIMMLAVREVYPDAIEKSMGLLNQIAALGHVLYLCQGERRRFMGPEELVQVCVQHARRHLPIHVPKD
jgi:hypothetical protein